MTVSNGREPCSGLQLRWSRRPVKARCWSAEFNPAGGAPAAVTRFRGRICFELGPAVMVIHRANVEPSASAVISPTGAVALQAELSTADSGKLRRIARQDPTGKLAVVMFGRILSKVSAGTLAAAAAGRVTLPLGVVPNDLLFNLPASLGSRVT